MPNLESVVRALNLAAEPIEDAVVSNTRPERRDIISETGFRLFELKIGGRKGRLEDRLKEAFARASGFLHSASETRHDRLTDLDEREAAEAAELSQRIERFANLYSNKNRVIVSPPFYGHGIIGSCEGDIRLGKALVELKYVDRHFRSTDVRQCLVYEALNYYATGEILDTIHIYNAFFGLDLSVGLEELVKSASGRSVYDFFAEFSFTVASGELSR